MNEVALVVEQLRQAMLSADQKTLESLAAEALSYGHSNGNIEDKQTFVRSIISGKDDFHSIDISDQTIVLLSDISIVRHRFKADVTVNGVRLNTDIKVLLIWQIQEGGWKLVARQAFKS